MSSLTGRDHTTSGSGSDRRRALGGGGPRLERGVAGSGSGINGGGVFAAIHGAASLVVYRHEDIPVPESQQLGQAMVDVLFDGIAGA